MELSQLMSRIAAGNKEAFRELYAQYDQTVYTIALAKTGDHSVAMDVVKGVFQTVYKTLRRTPYHGDFMAWLNALVDTELLYRQRAASTSAASTRTDLKHITPPPQQPPYAAPAATPYQPTAYQSPVAPAAPAYQAPAYQPPAAPAAPAYQPPVYQQPIVPAVPVYQPSAYQQAVAPAASAYQQPGFAAPAPQPAYAQPAEGAPFTPEQVMETAFRQDMQEAEDISFDGGQYRRYTNEEADELTARADAIASEPEDEPEPRQKGFGYYFLTVLGFAGSLVLLWMLAGLLMRLNILPSFDLGYAWFNEALFPLF
ncbi:MAG: hypothetical protein PHO41_04160 [Eubacteriales bacterium]|nr:hypothetical protein [Eubacteriales bacterium]